MKGHRNARDHSPRCAVKLYQRPAILHYFRNRAHANAVKLTQRRRGALNKSNRLARHESVLRYLAALENQIPTALYRDLATIDGDIAIFFQDDFGITGLKTD